MTNYDILKEYEAHKTPVPSYQEYLESESHCAVYSEVNKSLKEENERLKELLRECKSSILFEADVVRETSGKHSKDYKMLSDLLTHVDATINAIGEK